MESAFNNFKKQCFQWGDSPQNSEIYATDAPSDFYALDRLEMKDTPNILRKSL